MGIKLASEKQSEMEATQTSQRKAQTIKENNHLIAPCTLITDSSPINPVISNIPILSFFTGAGFLDLGFAQAGFNIVWRNECTEAFIKSFEYAMANLNEATDDFKITNKSPIEIIEARQILEEAFHKTGRPDTFGIIGGPPCPDFSVGGKNKGKDGDNGKLTQVFVERIIALQPTFFLLENVLGLLRTEKHRDFLAQIIEQLLGEYNLELCTLNALDFGVPQDRERIFLVGFLRSWLHKRQDIRAVQEQKTILKILSKKHTNNSVLSFGEATWFPWPVDPRYKGSKERFNWPNAVRTYGETPEMPKDIPTELMVGSFICDQNKLQSLPNGSEGFEPRSPKFTQVKEGDVSRKSFKRLHRWRYSPSVAYGNNEIHLHPNLARRLTVREALKIQTVPDTYVLPPDVTLTHKFKTISNGVPIKLSRAVALSFAAVLGNK
jgi:DNA (cytosine-5)-methyltransferase 1